MKYAFFTGMGRSGTKFLTALLNKDSNVHAVHEFIGNREYWLLSWYLEGDAYASQFLHREKKRIESNFEIGLFIDVNGYLQNSVPQLTKVFHPVKVFHFVRNPKQVIRSIYTRRNDNDIHLIPKNSSEIKLWMDGDKFTQICWNWASTTKQLLNQQTELILFEKVITDFKYFSEKILKPLNISVSETDWKAFQDQKINRTRPDWYRLLYAKLKGKTFIKDQLPTYIDWSDEQKTQFRKICGPVMKECGYDTDDL